MRLTHPALDGVSIDVPDGSVPSLEASGWQRANTKTPAKAVVKVSDITAPGGADTPEKESKS